MLECPCIPVGRNVLYKLGARLILGETTATGVSLQLLLIEEILEPSSLEKVLSVDPRVWDDGLPGCVVTITPALILLKNLSAYPYK